MDDLESHQYPDKYVEIEHDLFEEMSSSEVRKILKENFKENRNDHSLQQTEGKLHAKNLEYIVDKKLYS